MTEEVNRVSKGQTLSSRQHVIEQGVEVIELTAEARAAWVTTLEPVWQQFESEIGGDVIDAALAANRE